MDTAFVSAVSRVRAVAAGWSGPAAQGDDGAPVREVNIRTARGSGELWPVPGALIDEAVAAGMLEP